MKSKYNTGKPIDINELPEDEIKIAFHEWAEGSIELENLLNEGYKKGFESSACCGGDSGHPYIMYELKDEYSRKMAMSIAKKLVDSDLNCKISWHNDFCYTEEKYRELREYLIKKFPKDFSEESYSPTRTITRLCVYAKMENSEEVFASMANYIKEAELDKVKLPESEEEIPSKNFSENIKNQDSMQQYEKKIEPTSGSQSNNGVNMIDAVVEESKKDMRQEEINNAIAEVKQMEKNYIEKQTNPEQLIDSKPSIGV